MRNEKQGTEEIGTILFQFIVFIFEVTVSKHYTALSQNDVAGDSGLLECGAMSNSKSLPTFR
jgi:hypothetical protein